MCVMPLVAAPCSAKLAWPVRVLHGPDGFTRIIQLQGHLFRAAFLRHVPLFVRNLSENVVLCLAAAAVESTAKTMLAHMEFRWRKRLTSRMHAPYFENMVSPSLTMLCTCSAMLQQLMLAATCLASLKHTCISCPFLLTCHTLTRQFKGRP